ncbi:MAG: sterol desaturase family protein [Nannocystaceae bacterium]|nr:sterol desaturase family protein [Nannocystaceae bacterium]
MNTIVSFFGTHGRATLDPRAPNLSMRDAIAYFVRRPSAITLAVLLAAAVTVRAWLGDFQVWDALVAVTLVVAHPMTEWLIHVEILHFRPQRWFGRTVDLPVARDHRAHHADPHEPRWWFIPMGSLARAFVALVTLAWLLMPTVPLATTVVATMLGLGLVYEWTHYICHSSWRPRSNFYRTLWKLHRLHHFKNENYWMGVTGHVGDRLLGTMPDPRTVETSATCRNLDER